MQKWLLVLKAWEQTCAVAPEALSPLWRCSKTGPHRWWQTDVARITSNTEWPLLNCPGPEKKKLGSLLYSLSFSQILHTGLFLLARLVRISHVSVFVCSCWNQFWCHMAEDTLGYVSVEKWMRGWKESWWNKNIRRAMLELRCTASHMSRRCQFGSGCFSSVVLKKVLALLVTLGFEVIKCKIK